MNDPSVEVLDLAWITEAVTRDGHHAPLPKALQAQYDQRFGGWAAAFADARQLPIRALKIPSKGLHEDEVGGFLRAVDAGMIDVDAQGFFRLRCVRSKAVGGRYSLFTTGSHPALNQEYLIQAATAYELHEQHGWPAEALDFERGEFDLVGTGLEDRVTLAVEAKARVTGQDSLEKLVRAFLLRMDDPDAVIHDNAARKHAELKRLCEAGPVLLWLVAAGARWLFLAWSDGERVVLAPAHHDKLSWVALVPQGNGRAVLSTEAFDPSRHKPGTLGAQGLCSWSCEQAAVFSTRVRERNGSESLFALCAAHQDRVSVVYTG